MRLARALRTAPWLVLRRLASLVLPLAAPTALYAQNDCFPPVGSNEAQTMALVSVPLAFSALHAPEHLPVGTVRLTFEMTDVPNVSDELATPTVCDPGKGPENANLLPVFARPRVLAVVAPGVSAEAGWVPPVTVSEVTSNLVSLALGWTIPVRSTLAARLRAHATVGWVKAPITCDEESLQDPASECYLGTESRDELHPNIFGADATLGWGHAGGRLRPYLGLGYNRLQPRFRVNFTNRQGSLDRSRVEVDLNRMVTFAGADWRPWPATLLALEAYAAPTDGVIARVGLSYGVRAWGR